MGATLRLMDGNELLLPASAVETPLLLPPHPTMIRHRELTSKKRKLVVYNFIFTTESPIHLVCWQEIQENGSQQTLLIRINVQRSHDNEILIWAAL